MVALLVWSAARLVVNVPSGPELLAVYRPCLQMPVILCCDLSALRDSPGIGKAQARS